MSGAVATSQSKSFNPEAPHKAIVLIRYENNEVLPDGRIAGRSSTRESMLLDFDGVTHEEAQRQVNEFIQRIKDAYAETKAQKS